MTPFILYIFYFKFFIYPKSSSIYLTYDIRIKFNPFHGVKMSFQDVDKAQIPVWSLEVQVLNP